MKLLVVSAIFICFSVNCFTQTNEFAPIGAKWWYSTHDLYPLITPLTLESTADTVIEGKVCHILHFDPVLNNVNGDRNLYIYNEEGQVFQYIVSEQQFFLLYDFSLDAGEGYWCHVLDLAENLDSTYVQIISNEEVLINGFNLKKQYITTTGSYEWGGENIELIGNTKMILPTYGLIESIQGPLRCYEDEELGFYSTGETLDCDQALTDIATTQYTGIHVFPNPFTDFVKIENLSNSPIDRIVLTSIDGSSLMLDIQVDEKINMHSLPNGNYILGIQCNQTNNYYLISKI